MNALIKKEIRLLLPAWLAVMALAILLPWLFILAGGDLDVSFVWMPVVLFFSFILLAVDSFGREFSLGTYSALMSQPLARSQIWRSKMLGLFLAGGSVLLVYFADEKLAFQYALKRSIWAANTQIISEDFHHSLWGCIAAMFIAATGGWWTTLLFRQIAAAFWITFLTPLGMLMTVIFFVPARLGGEIVEPLLYGLAVIYCGAGFWLAHRLFHRSQDVAWTGGVISFSTWRYLETGGRDIRSPRVRRPLAALVKKEFQLHSISLFCAGALLALHLAVIVMRYVHGRFALDSFLGVISEFFWFFWLVMPLVIGCMAGAEERRLGVTNEQFCLPVSRRWQFVIKFIPAMVAGVLLGAIMPLLMEGIAMLAEVPTDLFRAVYLNDLGPINGFLSGQNWFVIFLTALATGLTLVGFFASTLARNFLQALSIAILLGVACAFFYVFMTAERAGSPSFWLTGAKWWGTIWPLLIGIPTTLMVIVWLAWRNFSRFAEGRLWRRNLFGVGLALVFVFAASALLYNRTWELFAAAESSHGPARLSSAHPPVLQRAFWSNLSVRLPDGRVWFDNLAYYNELPLDHWQVMWGALANPLPKSGGPQQFMPGSNWISVALPKSIRWTENGKYARRYDGIAAIRDDGTLWLSHSDQKFDWSPTNAMVRIGTETDWQQVAASLDDYFLLLKTDGTLWKWNRDLRVSREAARTNWPSLLENKPEQIGRGSSWQRIYSSWRFFAQDKRGNYWLVDLKNQTNAWLKADASFLADNNLLSSVHDDGTLWMAKGYWDGAGNFQGFKDEWLQMDPATNWVTAVMYSHTMTALKTDGSLWQWDFNNRTTTMQPTRLSGYSDWISLVNVWDGVVSLAADGGLWFWPGTGYDSPLFRATRQPRFIANVFDVAK